MLQERFFFVIDLHPTRQRRDPHVHQQQQRARPSRRSLRQPYTGRGGAVRDGQREPEEPRFFTCQTDLLVRACIERAISGLTFELQLRAILRDDDWERGDGSGRTASKANGNERGAAACMCTAGNLEKVMRGSEQDKARGKKTAPSAPARDSAHQRRVFVSLNYSCVDPYFSLELIDVLFLCAYQVVRTVQ